MKPVNPGRMNSTPIMNANYLENPLRVLADGRRISITQTDAYPSAYDLNADEIIGVSWTEIMNSRPMTQTEVADIAR